MQREVLIIAGGTTAYSSPLGKTEHSGPTTSQSLQLPAQVRSLHSLRAVAPGEMDK